MCAAYARCTYCAIYVYSTHNVLRWSCVYVIYACVYGAREHVLQTKKDTFIDFSVFMWSFSGVCYGCSSFRLEFLPSFVIMLNRREERKSIQSKKAYYFHSMTISHTMKIRFMFNLCNFPTRFVFSKNFFFYSPPQTIPHNNRSTPHTPHTRYSLFTVFSGIHSGINYRNVRSLSLKRTKSHISSKPVNRL